MFGIGSILALILGIVLLATAPPILGIVVVILSPVLAVLSPRADHVIEIKDLTVRFGGVTPIDGMSVVFESGTCGLIGPNGAGKTTFFNVMSGFVKPAAGTITAFGENLLKMADYRRARWGAAADVPDRDGDRAALDLRQRGDDPRALRREAVLAPRGRARRDSSSSG